jgi:hypothetical protein
MITVGIATLKEREESFHQTIISLYPQVDKITAVLNNYTEIPSWLCNMRNVKCVLMQNECGSNAKFWDADEANGYFLTIDDDLIVPKNYVSFMCKKVDLYNCPCSLHGKRYDLPIDKITSYRRNITTNIHCLHTSLEDKFVHVVGTGVLAFNTKDIKITMDDFIYKNMTDVQFALIAKQQNVPLIALAHSNHYLRYIKPVGKTIWELSRDDSIQTNILRKILS